VAKEDPLQARSTRLKRLNSMGWLLVIATLGLMYPYAIYPLLLGVATRLLARPYVATTDLPPVAILVSAFNEEFRILEKILNFDALDYPRDRIEMWIGTDGSMDRTAELVREANHPRVHLMERSQRSGKTAVLNDLARRTGADVLVFTDATGRFRPDAVRLLVKPLTDPRVGLVSGRALIRKGEGNIAVESAYYRLDSWMKDREGACGWLAGALGPIYALRASLYRDLPPEFINDLAHPCQVVAAGFEARFERRAISEEPAGDQAGREFDRQTRIAAQASYLLVRMSWVLLRKRRWGMLWTLISHKWLRWVAGIWIALGWIALAGLSPILATVALVLLILVVLGWRAGAPGAGIPVFFIIVHCAYLNGLWRALSGDRYMVWKPRAG
jgi:cellulose synthase/poly-beta-1,6-N-acetylglucosamine synthase-like glycosyltransferase